MMHINSKMCKNNPKFQILSAKILLKLYVLWIMKNRETVTALATIET